MSEIRERHIEQYTEPDMASELWRHLHDDHGYRAVGTDNSARYVHKEFHGVGIKIGA